MVKPQLQAYLTTSSLIDKKFLKLHFLSFIEFLK